MGMFKNLAIELQTDTRAYEMAMSGLLTDQWADHSPAYNVAIEGLKSANRKNIFWSKSDAMQLLNLVRKNEAV